jgi:hypothetical protein
MTLIIGILCEDGIVMAADGAATPGALGNRTVQQPVKKLTSIADAAIVGVSGPVGLGRIFVGTIDQLWSNRAFSNKQPHEAMTVIRDNLWPHVEKHFRAANIAAPVLGAAVATQNTLSQSVVAIPIAKRACLFQFDQQCGPEQATVDLPFVAIGSGQPLADPFLAFLRRIFWPGRLPTLAEGIFSAFWTLDQAIKIHPGGVAEPIQIMTLTPDHDRWKVSELLDEDFQEHREAIQTVEDRIRTFRDAMAEPLGADIPPTPEE